MGDHDHNWAKFALLPDRSEPVGTGSEPDSVPEPGSVPEPKSKPKIDNKRGFLREDMIAATTALQVSIDEIRNSQTNWESKLLSQGVIQRDVDFIRQLRKDVDLPDRNPGLCGDVFVNLLNNTTIDESTMQYVLFQLDDVISNNRDRVKIFHNGLCGSIYPQLLKMLNHRDPLIQHMAATIIAKLACWHRDPMEKNHLRTYLSWLMNQLKLDDMNYNQSVIRCLQMMLRIDEYRFEFLSFDGINTILIILASGVNFQIQYQLIYCLWVLTFNPLLAESMPENGIPILANILTETRKEKVTRIVLAVFRNLIEKPKDPQISKENSISMVHCKVLTQLSMLEQKRSNDEDIMNDVEFLTEILLNSVQCLSSFDEYATEVKSGNLNWSPMHKSAKFWLENAARLNEPGQGLLKKLVSLLQPGNDPVVLAVACHDIGEYVRHYPRGKQFVEDIGCKEPMMFLLNHDDPNVRNEALLAIQKLMVQNWTVLIKLIEKEQMEEKAEGRHKRRG